MFRKYKQQFSLRIELHKKKIDRVYTLWQKAMNDGIITDDELNQFNEINNTTVLTPDEIKQINVSVKEGKNDDMVNKLIQAVDKFAKEFKSTASLNEKNVHS